jgi:hypothetical protein
MQTRSSPPHPNLSPRRGREKFATLPHEGGGKSQQPSPTEGGGKSQQLSPTKGGKGSQPSPTKGEGKVSNPSPRREGKICNPPPRRGREKFATLPHEGGGKSSQPSPTKGEGKVRNPPPRREGKVRNSPPRREGKVRNPPLPGGGKSLPVLNADTVYLLTTQDWLAALLSLTEQREADEVDWQTADQTEGVFPDMLDFDLPGASLGPHDVLVRIWWD